MKKVLFVCTGNTCRSPMAEAVFNDEAKKRGLDFNASSAGLFADGAPLSRGAHFALKQKGIEFEHVSSTVNARMLEQSDYVFGITQNHARNLISMFPEYAEKIYSFPEDISDPFGQSDEVYVLCLSQISDGVDRIIEFLKDKKA